MSEIVTHVDNFLPVARVGFIIFIFVWLSWLFAPFIFYEKTEGP